MIFIIGGVICILMGFSSGETSCTSLLFELLYFNTAAGSKKETVIFLAVGSTLLIIAFVNEYYTNKSPVIPPRLFKVIHDVSV
jgi:hypothetical protein